MIQYFIYLRAYSTDQTDHTLIDFKPSDTEILTVKVRDTKYGTTWDRMNTYDTTISTPITGNTPLNPIQCRPKQTHLNKI
jgi:Tfp pilus assembly protein PilW